MNSSLNSLSVYISNISAERDRLIKEKAEKLSLKTVIEAILKEDLNSVAYNANRKFETGQHINLGRHPFQYEISPTMILLKYSDMTLREFNNPSVQRFYKKISKTLSHLIDEYLDNLPF